VLADGYEAGVVSAVVSASASAQHDHQHQHQQEGEAPTVTVATETTWDATTAFSPAGLAAAAAGRADRRSTTYTPTTHHRALQPPKICTVLSILPSVHSA
jgi:hypothetical protein